MARPALAGMAMQSSGQVIEADYANGPGGVEPLFRMEVQFGKAGPAVDVEALIAECEEKSSREGAAMGLHTVTVKGAIHRHPLPVQFGDYAQRLGDLGMSSDGSADDSAYTPSGTTDESSDDATNTTPSSTTPSSSSSGSVAPAGKPAESTRKKAKPPLLRVIDDTENPGDSSDEATSEDPAANGGAQGDRSEPVRMNTVSVPDGPAADSRQQSLPLPTAVATLDDSDEETSDDGGAPVEEDTVLRIANLPASRFHLPPDPSRQPGMVMVVLEDGDCMRFEGFNARIRVLAGEICISGGHVAAPSWTVVWGGEESRTCEVSAVAVSQGGVGSRACTGKPWSGHHVLLHTPPPEKDFGWAAKEAARLSEASNAVILLCSANRSALLQYLHSFHPLPRQQLLGNVLDRLQHVSIAEKTRDVMPFVYPPAVEQAVAQLSTMPAGSSLRVVLVGAANTGKSTLSRFICNRLLSFGHSRVAYLDTDLGQPEFTPPGCVSLSIVQNVITGPAYTHTAGGNGGGSFGDIAETVRSLFLGATSCQNDVFVWTKAVATLLELFARDPSVKDLPLVVNTHGWTTGLGRRCTAELIQRAQPHFVFATSDVGAAPGRRQAARVNGGIDTPSDSSSSDEADGSDGGDPAKGGAPGNEKLRSQVMELYDEANGVARPFLAHYEDFPRAGAPAAGGTDYPCGAGGFFAKVPSGGVAVVDAVNPRACASAAKGWWSRQALLTTCICGNAFNQWARSVGEEKLGSQFFSEGHLHVRSFLSSACPYVIPLSRVSLYVFNTVFSASVPDACPLSSLPIRLERTVVALYSTPAGPQTAANGRVRLCARPPHLETPSKLLGYGCIMTTSDEPADRSGLPALYLISPLDPLSIASVDTIVASLDAPLIWFKGLTESHTIGRVIPAERQGVSSEKRRRLA
ncbi:Polynucleotide 5prime-hydroxyl-kinase NOL9 [Diplonema papillatum]|nr:Polynucleotide 5prime-hydroxyl-kinase NOL9 [Diplonema papillatum]